MTDWYASYGELEAVEKRGVDFDIRCQDRGSEVAIFAPHGGWIEPGTSQLAEAIAGDDLSLYCFEGLKPGREHRELHITSTLFDEPTALALAARTRMVVGIHGRADHDDAQTVWMGGRDEVIRNAVASELEAAGFAALRSGHRFLATNPNNICNRGASGRGVQLELPRSLRDRLRADAIDRRVFADAIRRAL